jgi:hypothetical protein
VEIFRQPQGIFACPKPKYSAPQFPPQAKQWKNPKHRRPQRNLPANCTSHGHLGNTHQTNFQFPVRYIRAQTQKHGRRKKKKKKKDG